MIFLFNVGDLVGKYLASVRKLFGKKILCILLGIKALFIIPFVLIAL